MKTHAKGQRPNAVEKPAATPALRPVNAVDISVTFSPDQVEILGIDRGQSVITLWTEDPHVEGNAVIMRGGTYAKGFVGEHKIATLKVRAKASGKAMF